MKHFSNGNFFSFTRTQRAGLMLLIVIIIICQSAYFFIDNSLMASEEPADWKLVQDEMDSLRIQKKKQKPKVYPFNPNFITDFKAYKLGMSVEQIDRLLAFRKENRYVNSAKEFQQVTKVSDSLLAVISPYFKFPEWTRNRNRNNMFVQKGYKKKEKVIQVKDINAATAEDLIAIYGIGPALSERILSQKERLGGFVSMEQMNDIWGLSPEVIASLNNAFKVTSQPVVKKININSASMKELSQFPYFRYPLSKDIVTFRSMNGAIRNAEDLVRIKNFPVEKVNIIAVYLVF
ncbi:MAG TPA: helix-hairpin-helix domain-containing protein [Flavobacterium sp.]|jgi:DNA uptake protein ComE-like DNA-binding protein